VALRNLIPWRRDREFAAASQNPLFAIREDMDRLFDELWQGLEFAPWLGYAGSGARPRLPKIALSETASEFRVEAELPGLSEKDIEVVLEGEWLTLKGEKREERTEDGEVRHGERAYGRFERTLELPCEVEAEKARAHYKQGVLHITLPKVEAAKRGERQIEVRSS